MNRTCLTHLGEGDGQTHGCESPVGVALGARESCVEGSHGSYDVKTSGKWKEGVVAALGWSLSCNDDGVAVCVGGSEVGEAKVNECRQAAGKGRQRTMTMGGHSW